MDLTIHEVAHHRNGVCGMPFHAIRFRDNEEGREFVATVFGYNPAPHRDQYGPDKFHDRVYGDPHVAVLDVELAQTTIEFGYNSWRGDQYADDLYLAIDRHWVARDKETDAYMEAAR